jgi:hypothetical protein
MSVKVVRLGTLVNASDYSVPDATPISSHPMLSANGTVRVRNSI